MEKDLPAMLKRAAAEFEKAKQLYSPMFDLVIYLVDNKKCATRHAVFEKAVKMAETIHGMVSGFQDEICNQSNEG